MKLEDAIRVYPGRKIRGTHKERHAVICEVPEDPRSALLFYVERDGPDDPLDLMPIDFDYDWNVVVETERIVFEGVVFNNRLLPSKMESIPIGGPGWRIICEREK